MRRLRERVCIAGQGIRVIPALQNRGVLLMAPGNIPGKCFRCNERKYKRCKLLDLRVDVNGFKPIFCYMARGGNMALVGVTI